MCGIAAVFSRSGAAHSRIGGMTDIIRHRGPDDEGFVLFDDSGAPTALGGKDTPAAAYSSPYAYAPSAVLEATAETHAAVALGHRRLSIVDVSPAGHQPMCSSDRKLWIVYNGEVYNHIELRVELEALGERFDSHSDTEVILAAYRQWGVDCLSRFNGMFAFIVVDQLKGRVFIARDRFGVKPLYYWASPDGIAFASEIKQFTGLPSWQARMNEQRVYDFLNWGVTDHTDETLFQGVFQLKAGQALDIGIDELSRISSATNARLPVYDWYHLADKGFDGDLNQASEGFKERLTEAVRLRLRADVPVGSCLSGGLDSSSIVSLMNQLMQQAGAEGLQKTFSACSSVKRFDERDYISEVVGKTGVEAHYTFPEMSELFDICEEVTWHQDEPFGSTSIFAQWKVFQLAAETGVKVMLDGQGADEQLAGYHTFFAPYFAGLFKQGKWLTLWREIQANKRVHGYSELTSLKHLANMLLPEAMRQALRKLGGKASAHADWLNWQTMKMQPQDPFASLGGKTDSLKQFSRAQLTATNLQMLLHWEDRDSMAHSIESRVPFLDYRLVEYVLSLPDGFKLAGGVTKRVLRESMKDILPERVRMRMDKLGFVTPEEIWVRHEAPEKFRQAVEAAINASKGILNSKALALFDDIVSGARPFNFVVWRIVSFGMWVKQFNVGREK
ncbi:asparagine synthase (glutamine-hydrolyzing) [Herbaspirillum sp. WKF16]|uniref:asparagine synthase (glutamine-hydrolyzing) n=1 Tax=Herbaspirillum sp. WKF16 TaxID=3028312 RepID=UPI0023A95A97|nr:asparagine synthase (glutamine-hydrolyzing) [Herbaspirillum sp. WKF16]WDZ96605.1 asparagine synthase (glutamine-hydrolyzing) [Herbaspirillum sp. WKF16]